MGNHRSFRAEQELLLMPLHAQARLVVPVAAVYGANASGKSNLLDGLRFMADTVGDSPGPRYPGNGISRRPFKLDPLAEHEPSIFVVEVVENGDRYTYGFEVGDRRVRSEWLYSYQGRSRRLLFERADEQVEFGKTLTGATSGMNALKDLLRPDALFLGLAARANVVALMPAYRWFVHRLTFQSGIPPVDVDRRTVEFLLSSERERARVVALSRAADLGFSDVEVVGEGDPRGGSLLLRTAGGAGKRLRWAELSAGTRAWLSLLPSVLTVLAEGGTLVVDGIDATLHPLLAARLIALFRDSGSNTGGGQLIFTTHDATLLHPPLAERVLDRDEVWFVEKGPTGASTLHPLTEFGPDTGDNLERRYLSGAYGAVPDLHEELFDRAVRGGADSPA
ncbi:hypothetical protein JOF41_004572 [Saccharothrix coeruleofusca]|uniref:AAA family ATPase n=1 Tax=Saccharothrix coeruleofusca TaxID=33919 RepID=UPI001AEB4ED2|nr:ATP-binding protein [Saccharothrix coeruleofusca]MBP2338394.1 hypothetical protein [Saccharothrix coeruleofusca]